MSSQCPTCDSRSSASAATEKPRDADVQVATGTLALHQKLLITNVAPEGAELTFVQSVASKAGRHLTYLDGEIARLRDQLNELEEERALLSGYRAQNLGILSPLRRMPPEVLGEIFSWTLPTASDEPDEAGFDLSQSPWLLTHISSRWRTAALSTPSLWALVSIHYSDSTRYSLPILEAKMARARGLKIHFYGDQSAIRNQLALFQCLAERSSSWEELSISLTSELVPLLAGVRNCVQSLRRVWIQWGKSESQTAVQSIEAFRTAPALLDVAIYNQYRQVPIPIPSHQLTRYELVGPWITHEDILKTAPNLVEACITVAFDKEPWPKPANIVALLHLRRLFVSDPDILNYLEAPALQELGIRIFKEDLHVLLPDLEPFLTRSACNLRRISFKGWPPANKVRDILHKYPSITELAIITDYSGNLEAVCEAASTILSDLIVPDNGSAAASPQLSRIDFGCQDKTYIDDVLYLKMLESRWRADDCMLESAALLIESQSGLNSATLDGLHSLRADGLNLLLLSGRKAEAEISSWMYGTSWI